MSFPNNFLYWYRYDSFVQSIFFLVKDFKVQKNQFDKVPYDQDNGLCRKYAFKEANYRTTTTKTFWMIQVWSKVMVLPQLCQFFDDEDVDRKYS